VSGERVVYSLQAAACAALWPHASGDRPNPAHCGAPIAARRGHEGAVWLAFRPFEARLLHQNGLLVSSRLQLAYLPPCLTNLLHPVQPQCRNRRQELRTRWAQLGRSVGR